MHDDHEEVFSQVRGLGITTTSAFDPPAFEAAVQALLKACGVDDAQLQTGHMRSTAKRVRELWQQRLLGGVGQDPAEILGSGFEDPREDLVVLRGIAVHGVCPHHLVPFRGVAHVAYLPHKRVVGISKLARLVEVYAKRMQIQEKMTAQIANSIDSILQPKGVAVVIEAAHQCMTTRGVHKPGVTMVTSRMLGAFRDDATTRRELLAMIGNPPLGGVRGA